MIVLDCEQGSPEWHAARLGKVTASRVWELMARLASKKDAPGAYAASRANYAADIIAERLTGRCVERYTNADMQWGIDHEPQARALYVLMTGRKVTQVGIVLHGILPETQCSPDGLVGDDGLLEIKCPKLGTHLDTLEDETIPDKYVKQMQLQMACTGRRWCDFVSYHPHLPEEMQLFQKRVARDDAFISGMEFEITKFLTEIDARIRGLRAKYGLEQAA